MMFSDLLRNVVPRQGTEIGTRKQRNRTSQLRNVVPRQGTEMSDTTLSRVSLFLLRNVVPRQGTEMWLNSAVLFTKSIEKCSSPTGDGN